jgi:hypothetical protein
MVRMIRSVGWAAVASGALGAVAPLQAQATLMPPAMMSVGCEWVKPGMGPAHDQHEEGWARASEAVKGFAPSLAVQSTTGPAETCWITSVSSYDQLGRNNELYSKDPGYAAAMPWLVGNDAKFISEFRGYIAVLRPDLSAGAMPNVLTRRVTEWSEWRIRPGQGAAFEAASKAYVAAAKRAGLNPEFRVFQVMQGAPGDTYWIFTSQTSMAGFDAVMANGPKIDAAMTPEDRKLFDDFFAKAVMSMNSNIWAYNPAQSALTPEQRASDPFWKLKPKAAPKKP